MNAQQSPDELVIQSINFRKAAQVFRAINHKLRQEILRLLHMKGRMTVTQLYVKLNLEQSVASQHLAIMRKVQIVKTEREGKFIFYSVNYKRIEEIHKHAAQLNSDLSAAV
jgi:DNA-binding transcriptional ArsR family regulator